MQNRLLLAAAASAALFTLAGCNNEPETLNGAYDPQAEALRKAPPPPPLPRQTGNKIYRCSSDNSLFYVDIYNNNTVVIRRGNRQAAPTTLTAPGDNQPYAGTGYTLSGTGDNVSINGKACHT